MSKYSKLLFIISLFIISLFIIERNINQKPEPTATLISTLSTPTPPSLSSTATFEKPIIATDSPSLAAPQQPSVEKTVLTPTSPLATPLSSEPIVKQLLILINTLRLENGCKILTLDERLTQAALLHSQDMATQGYFDHNSLDGRTTWDRIEAVNYPYQGAAENIGAGYPDPEAAIAAWLDSQGHRDNLLNCQWQDTGIGYYYLADSPYGHYWTQLFGLQR